MEPEERTFQIKYVVYMAQSYLAQPATLVEEQGGNIYLPRHTFRAISRPAALTPLTAACAWAFFVP